MIVRSRCLLLGCLFFATAMPGSAQAEDAIRVLLAQDAPRIQVSAERRLSVQGAGGHERVFTDSVIIAASSDGTWSLNGEVLSGTGLTLSADGAGLTLRVGQGIESTAAPLVVDGTLRILRGKGPGGLAVVNHVDVEEYEIGRAHV